MEVILSDGAILSGSGAIDDIVFNCLPKSKCEIVDFTRYKRGADGFISYVTSNQSWTPIYVSAYRKEAANTYNTTDVANVFNSGQPTPIPDVNQIDDLLTPHQNFGGGGVGAGGASGPFVNNMALGSMFIINRTTNPLNAYDSNTGGKMIFDFSRYGHVSLTSITVMDVDAPEAGGKVVLYGYKDQVLKTVMFQVSGDNGKQIVDLGGTNGVVKMAVFFGSSSATVGSGGVDNIVFNCPPKKPREYGCTYTQGYWKNHAVGKKRDPHWGSLHDDIFYGSRLTYLQLLKTPPKGGNGYIKLAHQYIAAKLNMTQASSTPEVDAVFAKATAYFSAKYGHNYRNTIWSPYNTASRAQLNYWAEVLG
jgi:hypothetical protein